MLRKIVLIGKPESGKTAFLNRYVNKNFTEKYTATYAAPPARIDNIELWDIGNVLKSEQLLITYVSNAHAILYFFDGENRSFNLDEDIKNIRFLKKNAENAVLHFVISKADVNQMYAEEYKDYVEKKLAEKNIQGEFFITSAKDNVNLAEVIKKASEIKPLAIEEIPVTTESSSCCCIPFSFLSKKKTQDETKHNESKNTDVAQNRTPYMKMSAW